MKMKEVLLSIMLMALSIAGVMNIAVLESAFRSNTTWSNLKASVLAQYPSQELGIIRSFYFWDRN